jgi:CheY-like chemotaxis protein
VIIISTEGKEEDTVRGLKMGAKGYVKKPFQASELHALIERISEAAERGPAEAEGQERGAWAWAHAERTRTAGRGSEAYTRLVPNVRGAILLNTVRFVRETYGPDAHPRVLKALPADHCATFLAPIRDASWHPSADLEAYVETARALLAPQDPDFERRAGYFAGRGVREAGFEALLVAPEKLATVIWRALFDSGRVEVVSHGEVETLARIYDFPTTRSACQRMLGAWEGLLGARVEKTACVLDGSPWCEMRVLWRESPA